MKLPIVTQDSVKDGVINCSRIHCSFNISLNPYVIDRSPPGNFAKRSSKISPFEVLNSPSKNQRPIIWNVKN